MLLSAFRNVTSQGNRQLWGHSLAPMHTQGMAEPRGDFQGDSPGPQSCLGQTLALDPLCCCSTAAGIRAGLLCGPFAGALIAAEAAEF